MVGIFFSSSFHWYYIHDSRMYTSQIIRNSRTPFAVSIVQGLGWGDGVKSRLFQNDKKTRQEFLEKRCRFKDDGFLMSSFSFIVTSLKVTI